MAASAISTSGQSREWQGIQGNNSEKLLRTWLINQQIVRLYHMHAPSPVAQSQEWLEARVVHPSRDSIKIQQFALGSEKVENVIPRFLNQYDPVLGDDGITDVVQSKSYLCKEEEWKNPFPIAFTVPIPIIKEGDLDKLYPSDSVALSTPVPFFGTLQLLQKNQGKLIWRLLNQETNTASWTYVSDASKETIEALQRQPEKYRPFYMGRMQFFVLTVAQRIIGLSLNFFSKFDTPPTIRNVYKFLSSTQWAITLLSAGGSDSSSGRGSWFRKSFGHAMLLYEGVEGGLPFRRYGHLTNSGAELISQISHINPATRLFDGECDRPVFVHECQKPGGDLFHIRERTETFFLNYKPVLASQQEQKDAKPSKFSLAASVRNMILDSGTDFDSEYNLQLRRNFGLNSEYCLSYCILKLRKACVELPEPDSGSPGLEPDRYIQTLRSHYLCRRVKGWTVILPPPSGSPFKVSAQVNKFMERMSLFIVANPQVRIEGGIGEDCFKSIYRSTVNLIDPDPESEVKPDDVIEMVIRAMFNNTYSMTFPEMSGINLGK